MDLVLPASAVRSQLYDRLSDRQKEWRWVEEELKQLDPALSIVYWGEREPPAPGVLPGRFHIARDNGPGMIPGYYPIMGPNGEYREPGSELVEMMRRQDMQNTRNVRNHRRSGEARGRSEERAKETAREGRVGEIKERLKAADRPGVAFADTRWSNKTAGKRGRK